MKSASLDSVPEPKLTLTGHPGNTKIIQSGAIQTSDTVHTLTIPVNLTQPVADSERFRKCRFCINRHFLMRTVSAITLFILSVHPVSGSEPSGIVSSLNTDESPPGRRPNVVFLFTDDMRPDAIAALGHPVVRTPNIDTLVQRGFVCRNTYCMGSTMGAVCNPSRHMMLSGMSLYRYNPKQSAGTFGDVFAAAGYQTWHIGKRGNTAPEYQKRFEFNGYVEDEKERKSGHHGREEADRAVEFLQCAPDSRSSHRDRSRPLFMYVAFAGPHDPRVAADQWMNLYQRESIPLPANFLPFHPINNGWMTGRDETLAPWPRTPDVIRKELHDYYACISSIDHQIGRIFNALRETGEFDNTIFIFSSDHGLAIGSHGLMGKQNLFEHSMRAPLIFAGPGIEPGQTDALMYLFDIFPTACELAGITHPSTLDGISMAPVIRGAGSGGRETIFLSYEQGQRAVRYGDWKLCRFPLVNHSLLFNLKSDPDEMRNLATDPAYAFQLANMMTMLEEQQKHWGDPHPHTVAAPLPPFVDIEFFSRARQQK